GLGLIVAGCATRAENISAAYVSPIQYQSFTCAQLQEEAARVSARAAVASGAQDQKANNDAVATGVGVILFWPALFFIKGDAASAQEIAQLKGDMDAIEQANIQKNCGLLRIPTQSGRGFRFDVGRRSDLIPATIPI
ncbi:MAG: hypothetical protein ACLQVA_16960, partial [Candidatus Brocadiia bacterium]